MQWRQGRCDIVLRMAVAAQIDEEDTAAKLAQELTLPRGVKFLRAERSSSWDGDPAVRVYFSVSKRLGLSPGRISELTAMKKRLQQSIQDAKVDSFPFVHFVDVK